MPNYLDIETTLQEHLESTSFSGATPSIVWPNESAEFDAGSEYIAAQNITVTPVPVGVGDGDSLRIDGFYQVDIYVPRDSGIGRALEISNSLSDHFARGDELTTTAGKMRFKYCSVESGSSTGAHFHVILLVNYVIITV